MFHKNKRVIQEQERHGLQETGDLAQTDGK